MFARIYKPARNAMQSGKGKSDTWVLEFERETRPAAEPLMGWTSSGETRQQLKLTFDTEERAIVYAEREGIAYEVEPAAAVRTTRKSYSDNFRWGRRDNWTH